jgi:hypothetical protein
VRIIDSHVHLGDNRETKCYALEDLERDLSVAGAQGAVAFAFPEDMYRTVDDPTARAAANDYVLRMSQARPDLYPFNFVWNDYMLPPDPNTYVGIKWHRHSDEPRYDYAHPGCEQVLEWAGARNLPILIEEEFDDTVAFVRRSPELPIIIPHMGNLNGGASQMDVFFGSPGVYFDTSVASREDILRIMEKVGPERVLFGSDVSGTAQPFFNFPRVELAKVRSLGLAPTELEQVLAGNIERLIAGTRSAI